MRRHASVSAMVLAAAGLWAQGNGLEVDLGEVQVEAKAWSPARLAPSGAVYRLEAEDIAESGAVDAAEAIENLPGVGLSRYGPRGAATSVSLRGSPGKHVLVIVDGIRLNSAAFDGYDLTKIPAGSIERIELLRGEATAVYGVDAIGGVVLVTTKSGGEPRLAASLENSAWPGSLAATGAAAAADGQRATLSISGSPGGVGLAFTASGERAANAYTYGGAVPRVNAGLEEASASLSARAPLAGGVVRAAASGILRSAGVPGSLAWPSPTSRQDDSSGRASLAWSHDALLGGEAFLDLSTFVQLDRTVYEDPFTPSTTDLARGGASLRSSVAVGSFLDLGFGLAASLDQLASAYYGERRRIAVGGYLEPRFALSDSLRLFAALRYDWNSDFAAGFSAMGGLAWAAGRELTIRLNGGSFFRAPTFGDLYDPWVGDPDLRPERGWTADASARLETGQVALEASLFARYITDQIEWDPIASMIVNRDTSLVPGMDLVATLRAGPSTIGLDYEYLNPLDLSSGKTVEDGVLIDRISRHRLGASAGLDLGGLGLGLSARWWSGRMSGMTALAAALVVDARLSCRLSPTLQLDLAAENLLDTEYQLNAGYPMPGLSLRAGLRLELR